jgi:hypothetical protein
MQVTEEQMVVNRKENCGNSPKNIFIEDFVYNMLSGKDWTSALSDNALIEVPGIKESGNAADFKIEELFKGQLQSADMFDAISHGRKGAIDFEVRLDGGRRHSVAVFVEFKSLKADLIQKLKIIIA